MESLPSPPKRTVKSLSNWLEHRGLGQSFLKDSFEDVWDPRRNVEDFVTFASQQGVSYGIARVVVKVRESIACLGGSDRVFSIDGSDQGGIAQGTSVIVSSVFPVLPIIILYFIPDTIVRIGLILVLTAVFAAVLVFGLKLKPDKVLAITTA